jgi:hypothetical protein
MSQYDITTGKVYLGATYQTDFSDFTNTDTVVTKAYVDFMKNKVTERETAELKEVVSSLVGVTGSSAYLEYEARIDTIKEIADVLQEDMADAVNLSNYLSSEINRALPKEAGLSAALLSYATYSQQQDQPLSDNYLTQRSSSILAENILLASLAIKKARALTAEAGLSSYLQTETNRALTGESVLRQSTVAENNTFSTLNTAENLLMSTTDNSRLVTKNAQATERGNKDAAFNNGLSTEYTSRVAGVSTEAVLRLAKDADINNTLSAFALSTDTTLSGSTFTGNQYIVNSDIKTSGNYLYMGTKWRLNATATETKFQVLSNTIWKNAVVFKKMN